MAAQHLMRHYFALLPVLGGMRKWIARALASLWLSLGDLLLIAAAVLANKQHQFFCRPVPWASIALVVAFLPVVLYPLLRERLRSFRGPVFFLFGIAACICVYCIVFIGMMDLRIMLLIPFFTIMNPVAALVLLPHFLLAQIIFHWAASGERRKWRKFFASGVGLCLAAALAMAFWFNRNYAAVQAAIDNPVRNAALVKPSYMAERMLGMHFKYHMSLCLFDGWRPPLHDPFLVVATWLNFSFMHNPSAETFRKSLFRGGPGSPFVSMSPLHLQGRIAAYRLVFPGKPVQEDCTCAESYSNAYLTSPWFLSEGPRPLPPQTRNHDLRDRK